MARVSSGLSWVSAYFGLNLEDGCSHSLRISAIVSMKVVESMGIGIFVKFCYHKDPVVDA